MSGPNEAVPRWRAWWLPCLYMAGIFVLSSFDLGVTIDESVPFQDKGIHFLEYAVLGFLCANAARRSFPRRAAWRTFAVGAFVATAWGLGDELHQAFVPGRSADSLDVVADALGSIAGAGLRFALNRFSARPARVGPAEESQ